MSEAHVKRAAEWFLTLREIPLEQAHQLITNQPPATLITATEAGAKDDVARLYDTGLDASEWLWLRAGRAGRG